MKNVLRKVKVTGIVFGKGFGAQVREPITLGFATVLGIHQGLKYNGDLVKGLKTGGVILGVLGTVNGVKTVIENWTIIRNA